MKRLIRTFTGIVVGCTTVALCVAAEPGAKNGDQRSERAPDAKPAHGARMPAGIHTSVADPNSPKTISVAEEVEKTMHSLVGKRVIISGGFSPQGKYATHVILPNGMTINIYKLSDFKTGAACSGLPTHT